MSFVGKLSSALKNRTAYRAALLQAKAYRILKQRSTRILAPFRVSTIEWGLLGLLADNGTLRSLEIARELGVEAPFVSVMAAKLLKKGFIAAEKDAKDSRVKSWSLTKEGKEFLSRTEKAIRKDVQQLLPTVGARDVLGYLAVLELIVQADEKLKLKHKE